jgi:hypothetical protein
MPSFPNGQDLTPEKREEIAQGLVGGFSGLVQSFGDLLFDRPAFVAEDESATPLDAAVKAVTRLNCRIWAASPKDEYSITVNNGNAEICGPYLDSLDENIPEGSLSQELPNGQCPVLYTVTCTLRRVQDGATNGGSVTVYGPIGRTYVDRPDGSGGRSIGFECRDSSGNPVAQDFLGYPSNNNWVYTSFSAAPFGGAPDNCGGSPYLYLPPGVSTPGTPIPPDITVEVPGVGPLTVEISLGDDGTPTVCIPELDYCVEIPYGPQGGGGGTAPTPGDQGEPGTPQDVEGEPAEETDPDRILTGVLVELIEAPPKANIRSNPTEGYYVGTYYVFMGGDAGLAMSPEAALAKPTQFYPAPEGSNSYRVVPNLGVVLRATPYWKEPTA